MLSSEFGQMLLFISVFIFRALLRQSYIVLNRTSQKENMKNSTVFVLLHNESNLRALDLECSSGTRSSEASCSRREQAPRRQR